MLPHPLPFLPWGVRQGVGLVPEPGLPYLRIDSNEALRLGVELLLERDDNGLEVASRLLFDIIRHLWEGPQALSKTQTLTTPHCIF